MHCSILSTKNHSTSNASRRGPIFNEIKNLRKELRERETKAVKEVLSHANVILTTLTSATQEGPLKHLLPDHFDYVVIDECSQVGLEKCSFLSVFPTHVIYSLSKF